MKKTGFTIVDGIVISIQQEVRNFNLNLSDKVFATRGISEPINFG